MKTLYLLRDLKELTDLLRSFTRIRKSDLEDPEESFIELYQQEATQRLEKKLKPTMSAMSTVSEVSEWIKLFLFIIQHWRTFSGNGRSPTEHYIFSVVIMINSWFPVVFWGFSNKFFCKTFFINTLEQILLQGSRNSPSENIYLNCFFHYNCHIVSNLE